MPLNVNMVGATTALLEHEVDARWLMAYAAGIGDFNPRYMDTAAHTVIAHPVFPVCLEWPVILNTRELAGAQSLSQQEAARGVHAAHDLHLFRPIRAGDKLTTQATMIGIEPIKPGAGYTMRLDTNDAGSGELVARTYQYGIYRGVDVQGEATSSETSPPLPVLQDVSTAANEYGNCQSKQIDIEVPAGAAHTYTECARIWNPIHTDPAVALSAGLPDIILHGTATLALAISQIVDQYCNGMPEKVTRLGGRFSAMVLMPSTIRLEATRNDNTISFNVLTETGEVAISHGFVCMNP